jgi:hypothetical protein
MSNTCHENPKTYNEAYSLLQNYNEAYSLLQTLYSLKADSHIACRAHAVPLPCRAATGLECVFPI